MGEAPPTTSPDKICSSDIHIKIFSSYVKALLAQVNRFNVGATPFQMPLNIFGQSRVDFWNKDSRQPAAVVGDRQRLFHALAAEVGLGACHVNVRGCRESFREPFLRMQDDTHIIGDLIDETKRRPELKIDHRYHPSSEQARRLQQQAVRGFSQFHEDFLSRARVWLFRQLNDVEMLGKAGGACAGMRLLLNGVVKGVVKPVVSCLPTGRRELAANEDMGLRAVLADARPRPLLGRSDLLLADSSSSKMNSGVSSRASSPGSGGLSD